MELVKLNKNNQIITSSRIIAEKFEKKHIHVLEAIDNKIKNLGGIEKTADLFYETTYTHEQNKQEYREFLLTRDGFSFIVMGFTGSKADQWKLDYIKAFNQMEQALNDIRFRVGDKKHQLEMMELLHELLPEEMQKENINYIKANTVVNKCVSDVYGFPKMLSKKDMNSQMLETRSKVLEDYIKLFDILEDNSEVKAALYKKYERKQLE